MRRWKIGRPVSINHLVFPYRHSHTTPRGCMRLSWPRVSWVGDGLLGECLSRLYASVTCFLLGCRTLRFQWEMLLLRVLLLPLLDIRRIPESFYRIRRHINFGFPEDLEYNSSYYIIFEYISTFWAGTAKMYP